MILKAGSRMRNNMYFVLFIALNMSLFGPLERNMKGGGWLEIIWDKKETASKAFSFLCWMNGGGGWNYAIIPFLQFSILVCF